MSELQPWPLVLSFPSSATPPSRLASWSKLCLMVTQHLREQTDPSHAPRHKCHQNIAEYPIYHKYLLYLLCYDLCMCDALSKSHNTQNCTQYFTLAFQIKIKYKKKNRFKIVGAGEASLGLHTGGQVFQQKKKQNTCSSCFGCFGHSL